MRKIDARKREAANKRKAQFERKGRPFRPARLRNGYWMLLVNDPGSGAHRTVVAHGKDKGYLQRLSCRILSSNGLPGSAHMLVRIPRPRRLGVQNG
jgi:hypothetical protein